MERAGWISSGLEYFSIFYIRRCHFIGRPIWTRLWRRRPIAQLPANDPIGHMFVSEHRIGCCDSLTQYDHQHGEHIEEKETQKIKSIEGVGVCVNEEIYQDNPTRPNFPNYPQAVCPQDLDQEIQKGRKLNLSGFCCETDKNQPIKVSKT